MRRYGDGDVCLTARDLDANEAASCLRGPVSEKASRCQRVSSVGAGTEALILDEKPITIERAHFGLFGGLPYPGYGL